MVLTEGDFEAGAFINVRIEETGIWYLKGTIES